MLKGGSGGGTVCDKFKISWNVDTWCVWYLVSIRHVRLQRQTPIYLEMKTGRIGESLITTAWYVIPCCPNCCCITAEIIQSNIIIGDHDIQLQHAIYKQSFLLVSHYGGLQSQCHNCMWHILPKQKSKQGIFGSWSILRSYQRQKRKNPKI